MRGEGEASHQVFFYYDNDHYCDDCDGHDQYCVDFDGHDHDCDNTYEMKSEGFQSSFHGGNDDNHHHGNVMIMTQK